MRRTVGTWEKRAAIAVWLIVIGAAAGMALAALGGCGAPQKEQQLGAARDGLQVALAATDAARNSFTVWDHDHQLAIVDAATSKEDGMAKLAAYRRLRQGVVSTFTAAYTTIAAAATALTVASGRGADATKLAELAADALRAVLAVREAVATLKGAP